MAYFAKGRVAVPKPISYMAGLNQAINDRVKLDAAERQSRRKQALDYAKMLQKQRESDLKEDLRLQKEIDKRAGEYRREIRRMNHNLKIDPWLQPYWDQLVDMQVDATDDLTAEPEVVEQMLNNLIQMSRVMTRVSAKEDELGDLHKIATDYGVRSRANNGLKDKFMKIDDEEALVSSERADMLYNGGSFRGEGPGGELMWFGADSVDALPQLMGFTYDHKTDSWSDQASNVFESPYFHDQGNTGYMQTPYQMTFGPSFREHGLVEKDELQSIEGFGLWEEENARNHVRAILTNPSSVKGRSWRTQAVGFGPEAVYYRFENDPSKRDEVVRTIIEYDLYDSEGNMTSTYADNKGTIDSALKYAEDEITQASYFDNTRPRSGSGSGGRSTPETDYKGTLIESRRPYRDAQSGTLGSMYSPQWIRSGEIYITEPNPAVQEYEQTKAQALEQARQDPANAGASEESIQRRVLFDLEAAGIYPPEDETIRTKVQGIITYPDAPDTIWLVDEDDPNGENPTIINRNRDAGKWNLINGQIAGTSSGKRTGVNLDMIVSNDMGYNWQHAAGATPSPSGGSPNGFPNYRTWAASQPDGADDSPDAWREAKAAAGF